ncbi:MAG: ferritin-like domain-containing protein [Rivularia sp. (in: cyanobacteria)]
MTQVASKEDTRVWTKELVQKHAQTAVKVELYTLPFYLTALASIIDKESNAYKSLLSICIEEMLHLQLAANLCIALDTQPIFEAPIYGIDIPYLKPNDPETKHFNLINAKLDAFNTRTLDTMLDIETPNGLEEHPDRKKGPGRKIIDWVEHEFEEMWNMDKHETPNYPYSCIGEMYNALIVGIHKVGENQFSWNYKNQQLSWDKAPTFRKIFKQVVINLHDAEEVVKLISLQGEGDTDHKTIPAHYKLDHELDFHGLNEYSHYERLLDIKNLGLKEVKVYSVVNNGENQEEQQKALENLQDSFRLFLFELDEIWNKGKVINDEKAFWGIMKNVLMPYLENCWKSGVVPKWTP